MDDSDLYSEEESDLSSETDFDYEDTIIDFNCQAAKEQEKRELSVIESEGLNEAESVMDKENKEEVLAYLLETHTVTKNKNLRKEYNKAINKAVGKMKNNKDIVGLFKEDKKAIQREVQAGNRNIDSKIEVWVQNRNRNLAALAEKVKEEFDKEYTFIPKVNPSTRKRNIEQFLSDQDNFVKKVADKIIEKQFDQDIKESSEVKAKPKINKKSRQIAKERGPVYERLYNQRATFKIDLSDSTIRSSVISSTNDKHLEKLFKDGQEKEARRAKLAKKLNNNEKKNVSNINSNKMLFDKVACEFHSALANLYHAENVSISNNHNKVNFSQLTQLCASIKAISPENGNQTSNYKEERKLLFQMWEELKDQEGLVNVDELFIFLLASLRLYEYYIYKHFRQLQTEGDRKNIMNCINKGLLKSIEIPRTFGGFDSSGNYTLPFSGSNKVAALYQLFYVNWSTRSTKKKRVSNGQQFSFKPEINANSKQLTQDYRRKLIKNVQNETFYKDYEKQFFTIDDLEMPGEIKTKKSQKNLSHVDLMILKKKKQDKLNAVLRESKDDPEKDELTFKPKINARSAKKERNGDRFTQLYQKGLNKLKTKQDKDKGEMEIEKYGDECTFKPNINEVNYSVFNTGKDLVGDKDVQEFNYRMKVGRLERELKQNVTKRGYYGPNKLPEKTYKRDNGKKPSTLDSYLAEKGELIDEEPEEPVQFSIEKKLASLREPSSRLTRTDRQDKEMSPVAEDDLSSQKSMESEFSVEKVESKKLPLMEINVNISPEEKKIIQIYDGDTAEGLAKDFCREYGLEIGKQSKLEILIREQMEEILYSITEESNFNSTMGK